MADARRRLKEERERAKGGGGGAGSPLADGGGKSPAGGSKGEEKAKKNRKKAKKALAAELGNESLAERLEVRESGALCSAAVLRCCALLSGPILSSICPNLCPAPCDIPQHTHTNSMRSTSVLARLASCTSRWSATCTSPSPRQDPRTSNSCSATR